MRQNYDISLTMQQQDYYIFKLKECLSKRQRENPQYSLRAFSRDLEMHSSSLSQILSGKRALPLKRAKDIAQKLKLSKEEQSLFLESFYKTKMRIDKIAVPKEDNRLLIDERHYKILAEWEHYAIIEMFQIEDMQVSLESITQFFPITKNRAEVVLSNLLQASMLKQNIDGSFSQVLSGLKTPEDLSNKALDDSHIETLDMGKEKIKYVPKNLRDFSSMTVAINPEKLPEAKAIIREFRKKMATLLEDGSKKEIYQLAIQLYPLSTLGRKHNNDE